MFLQKTCCPRSNNNFLDECLFRFVFDLDEKLFYNIVEFPRESLKLLTKTY